MREDWKYQPLGEITTSINGLWKGKKPPFVNVGVIRNANFTKEFTLNLSNIEYLDVEERQYSSRKLQKGDLIVEKSGGSEKQPVGRTILFDLDGEYSVSNFTSILRIKDKTFIIPTFLYKYLLYIYKEGYTKEMQNATTGIHNIIYDKFLSIPIPILSLTEQERIVALLDDQFAKIDALKANAASQLQAAKDLFQSALKEMLTPKEGWEHYTINDVISDLRTGLNPRVHFKLNTPDADCYYITVRELKGFTIEVDEKTDLVNKEAIVRINQRSHLQIGDVLFSATGTIGNTALVKEIPQNWNIKEGIYVMTPRKEKLNSKYFIYLLSSDFFLKSVRAKAEGTGVKSIAMKNLVKFPISFPSLPEQERIAARLDAISEKVKALQANYDQTINLCNDLKQSLLKSIFA